MTARSTALAAALAVALVSGACDDPERDADAAATSTSASTSTSVATPSPAPTTPPVVADVDICPFAGLGTWVDVYDTVAAFAERGRVSPVGPAHVEVMRSYGVQTLYLQVAKDDPRSPQIVTDEEQAGAFLRRAHEAGMNVVAWYLPTHRDHELDLARMRALVDFEVDGQRFDGVALDIEGTQAVADISERNRLLLDLVEQTDAFAGAMPVGAIVYPPVVLEVLNPTLWPDFPWTEIAPHVDVWLPMAYWTFRDSNSPYREPHLYTTENVDRLRDHLDDPNVPVHVIGGIGDEATDDDLQAFQRAAVDTGAIGSSIYDFDTLPAAAWTNFAAAPVACDTCCSEAAG